LFLSSAYQLELLFLSIDISGSDDFISAVQKFMETSTLGEFSHRLCILEAFNTDMLEKGYCFPLITVVTF
jgi:hypothetical protein